jgi:hypothetical protein
MRSSAMGGGFVKEKNGRPKNKMRWPIIDRKIAAIRIHKDFLRIT